MLCVKIHGNCCVFECMHVNSTFLGCDSRPLIWLMKFCESHVRHSRLTSKILLDWYTISTQWVRCFNGIVTYLAYVTQVESLPYSGTDKTIWLNLRIIKTRPELLVHNTWFKHQNNGSRVTLLLVHLLKMADLHLSHGSLLCNRQCYICRSSTRVEDSSMM